jgi:hypothetical protein
MRILVAISISVIFLLLACVPVDAQCAAIVAGYFACNPILGPAVESGEDLKIGYDINAASGNLFLAQPDIHAYPSDGLTCLTCESVGFTRQSGNEGGRREDHCEADANTG